MSPNLGISSRKRAISRVCFYLGVFLVLEVLDAGDGSSAPISLDGARNALTDEELGVSKAYFGTAPRDEVFPPKS